MAVESVVTTADRMEDAARGRDTRSRTAAEPQRRAELMPTYVYEIVNEDGSSGATFEVVQRMTDRALTEHPETGAPVRRVPTAPNIAGSWSEGSTKRTLSDRNLDRLGFTKYQNVGDGQFEKRAGRGPDQIGA